MKRWLLALLVLPVAVGALTDEELFKARRKVRQTEYQTTKSTVTAFDAKNSFPPQERNGDEVLYSDRRASYNKGLSHQLNGFPDTEAFASLVKALSSGSQADFDAIQMGFGVLRLVSPQASFAYSLDCVDSWCHIIPPAPAFASAEAAGEMVELYCTALVRNVPFNDFDTDTTVATMIGYLNDLSDFKGPKIDGMVTPATFLRGSTPGDLIGPYVSQFLYLDIPWGTGVIQQEQPVPTPANNDFLTTFGRWFRVARGGPPLDSTTYGASSFIRNPRDLAEYVHRDVPGQAALGALLILNSFGASALDPANPYVGNPTQTGFVTFGIGQFLDLIQKATEEGLKAAWFEKWQVHRRLRPEEFGFYVQQQVDGTPLGIDSELIDSGVLPDIESTFGSYFLPIAYPEGSPLHPAYPAGHAAFTGAAVTILKALFDEDFVIPNPVEPNATNDALVSYAGGPLTVGDELNKLASNIALGRDHAGVHYRSDGYEGLLLGEAVAIDILNNESFLFNEGFAGYTLTKFDGTQITVGQKR